MAELLSAILDALVASVEPSVLREEIARRLPPPSRPTMPEIDPGGADPTPASGRPRGDLMLRRLVMDDILDEAILGARPHDREFPLRILFGQLGESLQDDAGFALATGLSFYFRVPVDEETRVRVGIEVSRLYYSFAEQVDLGREIVRQASPLLAELMSTQLDKVKLESVDHMTTFDSATHDRAPGSIPTSSVVRGPRTFLARVKANGMVRSKAMVRT